MPLIIPEEIPAFKLLKDLPLLWGKKGQLRKIFALWRF